MHLKCISSRRTFRNCDCNYSPERARNIRNLLLESGVISDKFDTRLFAFCPGSILAERRASSLDSLPNFDQFLEHERRILPSHVVGMCGFQKFSRVGGSARKGWTWKFQHLIGLLSTRLAISSKTSNRCIRTFKYRQWQEINPIILLDFINSHFPRSSSGWFREKFEPRISFSTSSRIEWANHGSDLCNGPHWCCWRIPRIRLFVEAFAWWRSAHESDIIWFFLTI